MQLTRHTDYALRLLIYLAGVEGRRAQIAEVAESQAISRTHLMKIANQLAHAGYIEAVRGRNGGISLGRDPKEINLGDIVRLTEPGCTLVDCTACRLISRCNLPGVLDKALAAFQSVLSDYSLADLIRERRPGPSAA